MVYPLQGRLDYKLISVRTLSVIVLLHSGTFTKYSNLNFIFILFRSLIVAALKDGKSNDIEYQGEGD